MFSQDLRYVRSITDQRSRLRHRRAADDGARHWREYAIFSVIDRCCCGRHRCRTSIRWPSSGRPIGTQHDARARVAAGLPGLQAASQRVQQLAVFDATKVNYTRIKERRFGFRRSR